MSMRFTKPDEQIDIDTITNAHIDDLMCVAMRNGKTKIVEVCRVAINPDLNATAVQDAARAMCVRFIGEMRESQKRHDLAAAAQSVLDSLIPNDAPGGLSMHARADLEEIITRIARTTASDINTLRAKHAELMASIDRAIVVPLTDVELAFDYSESPQAVEQLKRAYRNLREFLEAQRPEGIDLACAIVRNGGPYQVGDECVHISSKELAELKSAKHETLVKAACEWAVADAKFDEIYENLGQEPPVELISKSLNATSERRKALFAVARDTARELGWIP